MDVGVWLRTSGKTTMPLPSKKVHVVVVYVGGLLEVNSNILALVTTIGYRIKVNE
jgi:hypothetical protein